jgi:hypothetical protein
MTKTGKIECFIFLKTRPLRELNISQTITYIQNMREVIFVGYFMNINLLWVSKNNFPFVHNPNLKLITHKL